MKKIKYVVYREGKFFVSRCLNVEVSGFGETIGEATTLLLPLNKRQGDKGMGRQGERKREDKF